MVNASSPAPQRLRWRLLAIAAAPLLLGSSGILLAEVLSPLIAILVCSALSAGAVAGLIWWQTKPLIEFVEQVESIPTYTDGFPELPVSDEGEIGVLARAIDSIHQQANRFERLLNGVTSWILTVTKQAATPSVTSIDRLTLADDTALQNQLNNAYQELVKDLWLTRHRLSLTSKTLHTAPMPIIAVDETGMIRLMNPAGEELFNRPKASWNRKSITELFTHTLTSSTLPEQPDRRILTSNELLQWIRSNEVETLAVSNTERMVELVKGLPAGTGKDRLYPVIVRELTHERRRLAELLVRSRSEIFQQVSHRWLEETRSNLKRLNPAMRLAIDEAKRSPNREALLPRLTNLSRHLGELDVATSLMQWVDYSFWGELPAPEQREFIAAEVAHAIAGKLEPRFVARENSLRIVNQGGWMCFDEDWLRTMLASMLIHACDSMSQTQIELRIKRQPAGSKEIEPPIEFEIPDAGPMPDPSEIADLDYPLGGLTAPKLNHYGTGGFPLGLILTRRLISMIGGELRCEESANKRLQLRLLVPTLLPSAVEQADQGEFIEVGPLDELCIGWKLGRG